VLLAVTEEAKLPFVFCSIYNKTIIRYSFCDLLDIVFVISRILKVSARVISLVSLSLQPWLITSACTSTLIILDATKPHPLIV